MGMKKLYKAFSLKSNSNKVSEDMIELSQEQIDQLHAVLLMIVDDIMEVCDEEHLVCLLGGGSALGAIRHHGFIPWDDDIDINMPRESFEKFVPAFRRKFAKKYWVHTPSDNPKYGTLVTKVRLKGTRLKTNGSIIDDTEAGVFVDIFVIENVPDSKILRALQGSAATVCKACTSCRKFYRDRKAVLKSMGEGSDKSITTRVRLIIGFSCSFMSVDKWTLLTDKIFKMCKDTSTKMVNIPSGRWHYFDSYHERESFCKTHRVPFEGRMWPICDGIDAYMKLLYGDTYMQIPPESKREAHTCWEFDLGEYADLHKRKEKK